jgi:hypothetical protein
MAKMADIERRYMTVSLDVNVDGINLACWMSPANFWLSEREAYPFMYTHMGDRCTWLIHSNTELNMKMIGAVGETADRICSQQAEINSRRKLSNR